MKISIKLILLGLLLSISSLSYAQPTAKVTAKVVDDEGESVEGAKVRCGFEGVQADGWGAVVKHKKGISNQAGIFTAKGETNTYGVGCSAKKMVIIEAMQERVSLQAYQASMVLENGSHGILPLI